MRARRGRLRVVRLIHGLGVVANERRVGQRHRPPLVR